MRTTNIGLYALRLSYGPITETPQIAQLSSSTPDKVISRSAAVLAAVGIALSSFSLKQMLNKSSSTAAAAQKNLKTY